MKISEVLKVCKLARELGASRIRIHGVEMDFDGSGPVQAPISELREYYEQRREEGMRTSNALRANLGMEPAESTPMAVPAIKSQKEDPDQYAYQTDQWANQTRLPRGK